MPKSVIQVVLALVLLAVLSIVVQAQDMGITRRSYFVAEDAAGIQQVYHLLLGDGNELRQLTTAESDVLSFGVAYDGLAIAYISDGQLWLQPIHDAEVQILAEIQGDHHASSPVFSPDGQYIAYTDDGVWLLDLGTRETRQLLQDVPLTENAGNANEYRLYQPERFVLGVDGAPGQLVVDIGVWEWNSVGIYDLGTGELQELRGKLHTDLLPLYGGKALVYGNNGVDGAFSLHLADSLNDINSITEVVAFAELTDDTLFAEQATEIAPGTVRVVGTVIGPAVQGGFYFDYDLMAQEAGAVEVFYLFGETANPTVFGDISPDGGVLPIYNRMTWYDDGRVEGELVLDDLATGENLYTASEPVGPFRWQP